MKSGKDASREHHTSFQESVDENLGHHRAHGVSPLPEPCLASGRGRVVLLSEKFRRSDAGLLPFATHRASQALLGHPHRLSRLAALCRRVARPRRLSSCRDDGRRCGNSGDRPEFCEQPDHMQCGHRGLDRSVPLLRAARPHTASLCLRSRRLHREPDRLSQRIQSSCGL